MKTPKVNLSSELGRGASHFMETSGKRVDSPHSLPPSSSHPITLDKPHGGTTNVEMFDINVDGPIDGSIDNSKDDTKSIDSIDRPLPMSPLPVCPVDGQIYIGDIVGASSFEILKNYGITHIVNTAGELQNYFENTGKFVYKNIKLFDDPTPGKEDVGKELEPIFHYIKTVVMSNPSNKIFVHCHAGISRSATVVTYYLMKRYELSLATALTRLRKARPIINPNPWYMEVLTKLPGKSADFKA